MTGTVLGGAGGAAIGAALAAGVSVTPWAWAAAGVGALIGHAIGVHACHNHWRQAYYQSEAYEPEGYYYMQPYYVHHHHYYYYPTTHHHHYYYSSAHRYAHQPRG